MVLITIRVNRQDEQREGFLIRCEQCTELLYQRYQDVKHGPERPYYPEFYALDLQEAKALLDALSQES